MRLALAILCCGLLLMSACVVVKHDDAGAGKNKGGIDIYFANNAFDAKKYVSDMWDSKLLPYAEKNAIDLHSLLSQLAADEDAASKKYGVRHVAEGAPFNFTVKGSATVASVDKESRKGTAALRLAGSGETPAIVLQIGPIFGGTSIRDGLPFVKFDDFTNQLDYATLSNELNFYVRDKVTAGLDFASLVGKKIDFYGFITYDDAEEIVVTPVKISR